MGFELSRDDFLSLPQEKRDLVIYDNLIAIKKDLQKSQSCFSKVNYKIVIGFIWLFGISVALGLDRFIPFL